MFGQCLLEGSAGGRAAFGALFAAFCLTSLRFAFARGGGGCGRGGGLSSRLATLAFGQPFYDDEALFGQEGHGCGRNKQGGEVNLGPIIDILVILEIPLLAYFS